MHLEQRIGAFSALGEVLAGLPEDKLEHWSKQSQLENAWFTPKSVQLAIRNLATMLKRDQLTKWTNRYDLTNIRSSKKIAVIMAGNIPLVGFHDFLSVLISGHALIMKTSSKDSALFRQIISALKTIEPVFSDYIHIEEERIKGFDAVIATGSDNSARYFDYYFGKYPHIIRKNRSSCAVLTGKESDEDIQLLGEDIFSYFGLGCRNVSKIYVPEKFDLTQLGDNWQSFSNVIHHHKYHNNYDYQKAILLVNQQSHLDTGFLLLCESEKLVSPISVLHYEYYRNEDDVINRLLSNQDKLQCVVGSEPFCTVAFGQSQSPNVWDYADNVDTLSFLSTLK
jgi:hypothetical protein